MQPWNYFFKTGRNRHWSRQGRKVVGNSSRGGEKQGDSTTLLTGVHRISAEDYRRGFSPLQPVYFWHPTSGGAIWWQPLGKILNNANFLPCIQTQPHRQFNTRRCVVFGTPNLNLAHLLLTKADFSSAVSWLRWNSGCQVARGCCLEIQTRLCGNTGKAECFPLNNLRRRVQWSHRWLSTIPIQAVSFQWYSFIFQSDKL